LLSFSQNVRIAFKAIPKTIHQPVPLSKLPRRVKTLQRFDLFFARTQPTFGYEFFNDGAVSCTITDQTL